MSDDPYGFTWGPLTVHRMAHFKRDEDRESYVIQVLTPYGSVDVYVSRTGRSIRVFRGNQELTS